MATGTDVSLLVVTTHGAGDRKLFHAHDAVRSVRGILRSYAGVLLIEERRREEANS